jgi:hypothetical protein
MRRFFRMACTLLALAAVTSPPVRAEEPSPARPRESAARPGVPALRTEVLIRNLFDVLWPLRSPPARASKTRFDWQWLAGRHDRNSDGAVTAEEFPASAAVFERLDRNHDEKLTREDFDWADRGALTRQMDATFALYRAADASSDGRISAAEWQGLFTRAAGRKGHLTQDELEQLVFRPYHQLVQKRRQNPTGRPMGSLQRLEHLLETGRLFTDGPEPGEVAPRFVLHSPDGRRSVRLGDYRGHKPVVLIFGSFT